MREALENGVKAGYPMVDVRVELVDGSFHDVDSSEMAFKIAGSMAIQDAARKANPVLLEPVMAVEVVTPEDFLGDVIGDLSRRRGKVQGQEQRGNALAVQAFVPLGEMFGYATELRSIDPGPGHLHDAVRALRGGSRQHRRGDRRAPLRRAGGSSHHELFESGYISQVRPQADELTPTSKGRTERDVKGEVRAR